MRKILYGDLIKEKGTLKIFCECVRVDLVTYELLYLLTILWSLRHYAKHMNDHAGFHTSSLSKI